MDSLNGWVSGDSGLIFHTSDGGSNWSTQYSNDSLNIVNLFFLNTLRGWASAWSNDFEPYGTFILETTNGGLNWIKTRFRVGEKFANTFYFLDTLKGFAAGYPNLFMRTTDGGANWVDVIRDSSVLAGFPPYTIKFFNDQYGYACGGVRDIAGVVWRTTDGGISWNTVVDSLTSEPVYDLQIFDSLHVLAMGGDPEYGASKVVTFNGGNIWEYNLLGILWYPVDIDFRTSTEGWAPLGAQRKFLYSNDEGQTWSEMPTPDSVNVIKISFPDTIHGFGIGENGEMVKYVYQKPSSTIPEKIKISSFYLEQNYPNPFNPSTTISWQTSKPEWQSLKIYNVLGEEMSTLVNEYRPAGHYSVKFRSENLTSGVYFYKLQSGEHIQVRKMILLR
ncbi:MAG TPA: YCF48-related protein [Ignavibacteriaceae bacterium]|nr:YCF48-related protein [Ignavibacteriaceae bacterium]